MAQPVDTAEVDPARSLAARVGARLRKRRSELGRTLAEVAGEADVSVSYLSAVEHGGSVPSLPVLARITHALDVPIADVLRGEDEMRLKARYVAGRQAASPGFDLPGFERAYAILALQRATKVLGIFTRLALAEGKPGYQRHRSRLKALIRRTLHEPVLSPLRLWYEPYV